MARPSAPARWLPFAGVLLLSLPAYGWLAAQVSGLFDPRVHTAAAYWWWGLGFTGAVAGLMVARGVRAGTERRAALATAGIALLIAVMPCLGAVALFFLSMFRMLSSWR